MPFEIDQKLFKWVIAGIIFMCLVSVAGVLYKATDGFSVIGGIVHSEDKESDIQSWSDMEDVSKPWGQKQFNWTYNGEEISLNINIPKAVYNDYEYGISDTVYPENITCYIKTSGGEDVLSTITEGISRIIKNKGYTDDKDVSGLILSFVKSIPYETDSELGHSYDYPRAPAVTLADGTGDSGDHSILAASLLREFGYGVSLIYYPSESFDEQTIIPEAIALGLISDDDTDNPVYSVKNGNTTKKVIPVWTVDVLEKGFPVSAYYTISPEIFADDSLWYGAEYDPCVRLRANFVGDLKIHHETIGPHFSENISFTSHNWQQETSDYYETLWYPSGASWSLNDKWRLYDKFFDINENSRVLYTPWGFAETNTLNPWRITFQITEMDKLRSDKDMTPYSDVWFVLYEINSTTGETSLYKKFGWQGLYGADLNKIAGPFSPGEYILGIFVRNTALEVSVEYSGKEKSTNYTGPI